MFSVTRFAASAVILGCAAVAAWGLTQLREAPKQRKNEQKAYLVTAQPISRYTGAIDIEVTGIVVPFREIEVSAQASGRVIWKSEQFESGIYVKAGTELLKIDPTDYELEIVRLEAELASADSTIAEMEVELEGARELLRIARSDIQVQMADFQRKSGAGGFSKSEIDQERRSLLAAETTVTNQANRVALLEKSRDRLEASKKLRQAQLEQAEIQKDRCLVTAPADGVVVEENVELGSYVAIGNPLLTFEDTSQAEVSCNLRPDQLDWLWNYSVNPMAQHTNGPYRIPQVPVRIFHDTTQGTLEWSGTLDRYDGIGVDERTKTIPCIVTVKKPTVASPTGERALLRGMFVKLRIELPTEPLQQKNKFFAKIPTKGLLAGNLVWMVRQGKLAPQVVNVIDRIDSEDDRSVVIELAGEGIQDSDLVVVSPVGNVADDVQIKVVSPEEALSDNGNVTFTSGAGPGQGEVPSDASDSENPSNGEASEGDASQTTPKSGATNGRSAAAPNPKSDRSGT